MSMQSLVSYQCGDKMKDIELRLVRENAGWVVAINHKQDAPEADYTLTLKLHEAKMLCESLGGFVNTLEWFWKNERRW